MQHWSAGFASARRAYASYPALVPALAAAAWLVAAPAPAQYRLVSLGHDGSPADGPSTRAFVSGNGRFVAFTSEATNLVPGDTNGVADVFVRDLQTNITTRVSVATGGAQADAASDVGGISDDGNIVVFETRAALAAADTNQCVSGEDPPTTCTDIYVHNRATGETVPVSVSTEGGFGNGHSTTPRLSGDGRYVVFASLASNFGQDTNGVQDIFLRDRLALTTTRVSLGPDGEAATMPARAPAISRNGRVVAFLAPPGAFATDPGGFCGGLGGCHPAYVRNLDTHSTRAFPWRMLSVLGRVSTMTEQVYLNANGTRVAVNTWNTWHTIPDPFTFSETELYDVESGEASYGPRAGEGVMSDDGRYFASRVRPTTSSTTSGVFILDAATGASQTLAAPDEASVPSFDSSGRYLAFTSDHGTLVPGDTNGVADAFVYDLDQDGDGLPTLWELHWGFDPASPADATADPDGDGLTNAQEYAANAHPKATHTRYFAEGAANEFFATQIAMLNPGNTDATVLLRLLGPGGAVTSQLMSIPANDRRSVNLHRGSTKPASTFAIVIESDQLIVADRLMRWQVGLFDDGTGATYGSHLETATEAPRQTWHFAEGATGPFSMYYLLQNPGDQPASVTIDYLRLAGQPVISKTYKLAAHSRLTIDVAGEHADLAHAEISAKITSTQPIVAERALYRSTADQLYAAGHAGAAIAEPSTRWFLAEGATGFFDEYVLIANPNASASQVEVMYMPEGAASFTEQITVGGLSRFTLEPKRHASLASVPLSIALRSINDVPVVAERAMWWPAGVWYEASLSAGVTQAGTKWAIAEADTFAGGSTYVLIANVDDTKAADVKVSFPGAAGNKSLTVSVPKNGRYTVDINSLPADQRPELAFGVIVESLNGAPIVVERSLYQSRPLGPQWENGATSVATNLAPVP